MPYMSLQVISCPFISFYVILRHGMSCHLCHLCHLCHFCHLFHAISRHFMSFHVISCQSCHFMLFRSFMSFHVIRSHFMSFHVISCHSSHFMLFMSFQVILCNLCHVISCHFMSFLVSLDFSDQLLKKSGGEGQGDGGSNMSSLAFGDSLAVRPKAKMIPLQASDSVRKGSAARAHRAGEKSEHLSPNPTKYRRNDKNATFSAELMHKNAIFIRSGYRSANIELCGCMYFFKIPDPSATGTIFGPPRILADFSNTNAPCNPVNSPSLSLPHTHLPIRNHARERKRVEVIPDSAPRGSAAGLGVCYERERGPGRHYKRSECVSVCLAVWNMASRRKTILYLVNRPWHGAAACLACLGCTLTT
jgi:hypothetical protein